MKKLLLIFGLATFFFTRCYYDKLDDMYPGQGLFNTCDTTSHPSYAHHIVPILQNYCYSCHAGTNSSSGFQLDDYPSILTQVQNGNVSGCINHAHLYNPMPPSFSLDTCNLNLLNHWITDGAPNN